jgi:hypothetical protein
MLLAKSESASSSIVNSLRWPGLAGWWAGLAWPGEPSRAEPIVSLKLNIPKCIERKRDASAVCLSDTEDLIAEMTYLRLYDNFT